MCFFEEAWSGPTAGGLNLSYSLYLALQFKLLAIRDPET